MTEQNLPPKGIKRLFSGLGVSRPPKRLTTANRLCENGHAMSLDWLECPYCKAEQNARQRTVMAPPTVRPNPPVPPTKPSDRRKTMVLPGDEESIVLPSQAPDVDLAAASAPPPRNQTLVFSPDEDTSNQPRRHVPGGRRLTGVVFTFTWSNLGQLFEVRDGRNFVGRSTVGTEGDRLCDIQVPDDSSLSAAHFLILCQGRRYNIRDNDSTGGTFVNGEQIDSVGIELVDGAVIKAGNTLFAFQKVSPPSMEGVAKPEAVEEEPPAPPPRARPFDEDKAI